MILALFSSAFLHAQDAPLGTFKSDPVELIDHGRDVPGDPGIWVVKEGYRYLFSSQPNKARFEATSKYEIQLGGGCGKMGSLGGRGSIERYAVSGGKLYLFASDGCRSSFLADPEPRIERDDAKPVGSPEESLEGQRCFDRVVQWMGGKEALLDVSAYEESVRSTYRRGGKDYPVEETLRFVYPNECEQVLAYGKDVFRTVAQGGSGYFESPSGKREPFYSAQARELVRIRDHTLLPSLVSGLNKARTLVGKGDGSFELYRSGTSVRIWSDPKTGEVRAIESRGRSQSGAYGARKLVFTGFKNLEGIQVPTGWNVEFEGHLAQAVAPTELTVRVTRRTKQ